MPLESIHLDSNGINFVKIYYCLLIVYYLTFKYKRISLNTVNIFYKRGCTYGNSKYNIYS